MARKKNDQLSDIPTAPAKPARKAKAAQAAGSAVSRSPFRRLPGRRAKAALAMGVVMLLAWGASAVWRAAAPTIAGRDRYLLRAENIEVTAAPEWIAADVASQVIHNAGVDGRLSILDESFPQAIESAFALHPWVERVNRVEKRYPPAVSVEVTYRRPVAAIDTPHGSGGKLLPVDGHSIHLPAEDLPLIRLEHLPRIMGIVGQPPVGRRWDDPRVSGAVELAVLLSGVWEPWHLTEINPSARPEVRGDRQYFVYEMVTRGGTHIVWGAAPQAQAPGEAEFQIKLSRLERCIQQYGPLDSVSAPGAVNVRGELEVSPRLVKEPDGERLVKEPAAEENGTVVK